MSMRVLPASFLIDLHFWSPGFVWCFIFVFVFVFVFVFSKHRSPGWKNLLGDLDNHHSYPHHCHHDQRFDQDRHDHGHQTHLLADRWRSCRRAGWSGWSPREGFRRTSQPGRKNIVLKWKVFGILYFHNFSHIHEVLESRYLVIWNLSLPLQPLLIFNSYKPKKFTITIWLKLYQTSKTSKI